jgi:hypothetical protein
VLALSTPTIIAATLKQLVFQPSTMNPLHSQRAAADLSHPARFRPAAAELANSLHVYIEAASSPPG